MKFLINRLTFRAAPVRQAELLTKSQFSLSGSAKSKECEVPIMKANYDLEPKL